MLATIRPFPSAPLSRYSNFRIRRLGYAVAQYRERLDSSPHFTRKVVYDLSLSSLLFPTPLLIPIPSTYFSFKNETMAEITYQRCGPTSCQGRRLVHDRYADIHHLTGSVLTIKGGSQVSVSTTNLLQSLGAKVNNGDMNLRPHHS